MQRTRAIEIVAVLSKCGSHHHYCQSQLQSIFIVKSCFFGEMTANFHINEFTIAPENSRKIGRAPCGVRLISYNAVRCPAWHRPMLFIYIRRPAPVRYVITQEKFLNNRPVPGQLSNSPVMCKSLKSYDVSFICDQ